MNQWLHFGATLALVAGTFVGLRAAYFLPAFLAILLASSASWIWLRRRARALGSRVAAADARLCTKCDYPLMQGEIWLHCPECGHETDPNKSWRDWQDRLAPFGYRLQLPWLFLKDEDPKRGVQLRTLERVQVIAGVCCLAALLGIVTGFPVSVCLTLLVISFIAFASASALWSIRSQKLLLKLHQHAWHVCPDCEATMRPGDQSSWQCIACWKRSSEPELLREWDRRVASWRLRSFRPSPVPPSSASPPRDGSQTDAPPTSHGTGL